MADPISIAGLALALCETLFKVGERTAQLISDAKTFEDDNQVLQSKISDENNRTRLLRNVLFEPSPIYGGLSLFENFDEDVQQQIRIFLNRLLHTLKEACDLLEKRYGSTEMPESSEELTLTTSTSQLSLQSPVNSIRSPSPRSSWKSISKRPMALLRWSFQDKKRTHEILNDFADLNNRILKNIKLWCFASSIGLNMQHLHRLQEDESSKKLGFDIDATLKLAANDAQANTTTFELDTSWIEPLRAAKPVEERFALVEHGGRKYLQEHRYCGSSGYAPGEVDERTKSLVDDLARLLHQPKELVFCIPRCIGWKYLPGKQNIAFIFDLPKNAKPRPISLFQMLDSKEVRLSLGERFRLAFALANCIAQLQMVKWVHESFRSENILFFPENRTDTDKLSQSGTEFDYTKPLVLGFEFSRPEIHFSSGSEDVCVARDIYRHPDRQGRPGKMFTKIHDIYALGVVLLEIGLWQRAVTFEKHGFKYANKPQAIREAHLRQAHRRLGDKMGERYRDVVIKCLSGDFGVKDDTKEDLKLQQAFRTQVVDVLDRAAGNV